MRPIRDGGAEPPMRPTLSGRFRRLAGLTFLVLASLASLAPRAALGQADAAISRGLGYLRSQAGSAGAGECALIVLAMAKAEAPLNDPGLVTALDRLKKRFNGTAYTPERGGGPDIYEASVTIMALANLDPDGNKGFIQAAASHIASKQNANGSWDYAHRSAGDTSISQYAILGLWEASTAGVNVSPSVWDRAAGWCLKNQAAGGSWDYHRDEGSPETLSMTAAGIGTVLICQRQLADYKRALAAENPYLIPLNTERARTRYTADTPATRMTESARAGLNWIARNFSLTNMPIVGQTPFYYLYGVERIGALAEKDTMGNVDWFDVGRQFILSKQNADGSWNSEHGTVPNTTWAILFLTKSTAKTVEKIRIRRLGAGTLVGGRGLPKDLSSISVAGGRVVAKPMVGAVEGMLAVLEDPRAENADSALAGLISRYQTEGPKALTPYKDRFRKLLTDSDPGVRRVAAWAIGRMAELSMVPVLLPALRDPDEGVVREAQGGLKLLSRKIEGYGPPPNPTAEQREQAIARWSAWYESARPIANDARSGSPDVPRRSP